MENQECRTNELHIAHANELAREIYLKYSFDKQNEFVKQFLNELKKRRVDGVNAAIKDLYYLSDQFYTSSIEEKIL